MIFGPELVLVMVLSVYCVLAEFALRGKTERSYVSLGLSGCGGGGR